MSVSVKKSNNTEEQKLTEDEAATVVQKGRFNTILYWKII